MKKLFLAFTAVAMILMCFAVVIPNDVSYANSLNDNVALPETNIESHPLLNFNDINIPQGVEDFDYMDLMTTNHREILYQWLIDLGFSDENEDDMGFVERNNNKIILKAIHLGIIDNFLEPEIQSSALRWGGETHKSIMTHVVNTILKNDNLTVYNFFKKLFTYKYVNLSYDDITINNYLDALHYGHLDPDWNNPLFGTAENTDGAHMYVYRGTPSTNGTYYKNSHLVGESHYSRSARTRFEEHYSSALTAYKAGYYDLSMFLLGRATHYMADIGCTAHSAGIRIGNILSGGLDAHTIYEDWVNSRTNTSYSTYDQTYFLASADSYNFLSNSSFENIINTLAYSTSLGWQADILINFNTSSYGSVAKPTFQLTQSYIAGLLNRFYLDVQDPVGRNVHYLNNNKTYYLKNVKSGMYMDVQGWKTSDGTNVHQFSFHGDENQKFRFFMNSQDGSLNIAPINALTKRLDMYYKSLEYNTVKIKGQDGSYEQSFKITYVKDGYYRIMAFENRFFDSPFNYARVVRVASPYYDLRCDVDTMDYNPDSMNHYWYLEEATTMSVNQSMQLSLATNEVRVIEFTPTTSGYYNFETSGSLDTYFKLQYRIGTGNSNIYNVGENDDGGSGYNARLNVYLTANYKYKLFVSTYTYPYSNHSSSYSYGTFNISITK